MPEQGLERYIRLGLVTAPGKHPQAPYPRLELKSDADFGNLQFSMMWAAIPVPFEMVAEHHKHDFDQYLIFHGGDMTNMADLGGEVELTLSEDGVNKQKFVFTQAVTVFIRKGLYHGPLNFKKVKDPGKPIVFQDLYFAPEYQRLTDK